jgi:ferredoxin
MPEGEHSIVVAEDEHIWDAANAQGIVLPAICHQGRCLACAGHLESAAQFDQSDADTYFPEDRAAGFILLCTAKPVADLTISTHQDEAMRAHRLAHDLPAPYA